MSIQESSNFDKWLQLCESVAEVSTKEESLKTEVSRFSAETQQVGN